MTRDWARLVVDGVVNPSTDGGYRLTPEEIESVNLHLQDNWNTCVEAGVLEEPCQD